MSHEKPGNCEKCGTPLAETGAPIWETYCPNDGCTHDKDEFEASMRQLMAASRARERVRDAAPDHAAIGWAMCVAAGRWEPWGDGRGEFCMNGIRYATKLDEFGVPVMTDGMRAAISKATGQTNMSHEMGDK